MRLNLPAIESCGGGLVEIARADWLRVRREGVKLGVCGSFGGLGA